MPVLYCFRRYVNLSTASKILYGYTPETGPCNLSGSGIAIQRFIESTAVPDEIGSYWQ